MKKTIVLLITFCMFISPRTFAVIWDYYYWTDNNGVKWTFGQDSYTINGSTQTLWTIAGLSNYGENVVFPEVVYKEGTTACKIEAIKENLLNGNKCVTSVTLPSSIKYIDKGALNFNAGTVTLLGSTPPFLNKTAEVPNFGEGVTIMVSSNKVSTYQEANGWENYALRIISKSVTTNYNITVSAMDSGSGVHAAIGEENLKNVMSLKITGSINSYDIVVMRNKMFNLHHLDLTDASIVYSDFSYYGNDANNHTTNNCIGPYAFAYLPRLITIKLPKTIKSIESNAFYECKGLRTVDIHNGLESIGNQSFFNTENLKSIYTKKGLKTIGERAFEGSTALESLKVEECEVIKKKAFRYCSSLVSVALPDGLTSIESASFANCTKMANISLPESLVVLGAAAFAYCSNLQEITIPDNITKIESSTFYQCSKLATISFPMHLKKIGGGKGTSYVETNLTSEGAFANCRSLKNIVLPEGLESIGEQAFYQCTSLESIHIPSSTNKIGSWAFYYCIALQDIYTCMVEPISNGGFSNYNATLHVPSVSYYQYYFDSEWRSFANIKGENYNYDYFLINKDFTFNNQTGVVNGVPDADLNAGSGLVVNLTGQKLQLNEVHMASNATTSASIIANNNLSAEKLYFDIAVDANKWYFFSFPFRVKLANTTSPGDFVFRYYDGQTRATNGSGGWKNVTTTDLNASQGYIYRTNTSGTLSVMVEKTDINFSGNTMSRALNAYSATDAKNASWNLVGNMHPCYFDISQMGYTAPITVWNGSSYVAKRASDDQYSLSPFQAFFVQKPSNVNNVSFPSAGRYTKTQWDSYVASQQSSVKGLHAPEHSERAIVNLTIGSGEDVVDETRVVFNAATSTDYEMDCDAAKFISDQPVPQLYTLGEDGTQYAINERPAGKVTLCYVAPSDGELSISAPRMDQPVYLQDNVLGITHDLSLGAYIFTTEAGTFENRFVLRLNNPITGIADMGDEIVNGKAVTGQWFDLQGRQHSGKQMPKGVYVVKSGAKSIKVVKQ